MENYNAIKKLAQTMLNRAHKKERDNKSEYWVIEKSEPWMTDICREAHDGGNILPDDFRYAFIVEALSAICDHDDVDQARESLEADIYNNELTSWLASRLDRSSYCDQAKDDFGANRDIIANLSMGQLLEKWEVFDQLISALNTHVEHSQDTCESL